KPEKPTQPHSLLGHPAPAIALNDATDRQRALSESLKNGPVVLVFYYGYSCNHCVSQLFDLQEDLKYFRELGAEIVAISPDSPAETREKFAEYGRFDFTVLSDPDNRAAEAYEAFHRGQSGAMEFSQHGTFVIGRDGRVAWAYLGPSPFADNATLLHVLARLEGRDPTSASHATPEATGPLEASLSSPSQTALAP
ncbi:MAG TPA: redoxin domain-containing protein, partial [Pirellulales bacterium]